MGRWILRILLGVCTLAVVLAVAVRLLVGGLSMPVGDYQADEQAIADRIRLPRGFNLKLWAEGIPNARILRFTRKGDLLVANPNLDRILLLEADRNRDGRSDGHRLLMEGLNGPNGMDFHEGWLYIAETDAIGRVAFDHATGRTTGDYQRLITGLPGGENHWKKTLRFGPDGLMYVTFGSSCNVCVEKDSRRAAMLRYKPDGTGEEIYATGLRNSAGFDWSPRDGALYATDNGRDLLGDDFPPCELNRIVPGAFYGWPFANGDRIPDPDLGAGRTDLIAASTPPVHAFAAHNAPLGIEFIDGSMFPDDYRGAAVVALHGSWNRSRKDGYKVVSLHWDAQGNITQRDLVTGFLLEDRVIGRPAEVVEGPDGAIYISDDYAGAVYRLAYGEEDAQALVIGGSSPQEPYDPETTLAALTLEERQKLDASGEQLFRAYGCAECHNQKPGSKPLQRVGYRHDLSSLQVYLARPTPPMPVYPLATEDRRALGVYLIRAFSG